MRYELTLDNTHVILTVVDGELVATLRNGVTVLKPAHFIDVGDTLSNGAKVVVKFSIG